MGDEWRTEAWTTQTLVPSSGLAPLRVSWAAWQEERQAAHGSFQNCQHQVTAAVLPKKTCVAALEAKLQQPGNTAGCWLRVRRIPEVCSALQSCQLYLLNLLH